MLTMEPKQMFSSNGEMQDFSSTLFFAAFGASYNVYRNKSFSVQPQIKYNLGLNDAINSLSWKN